MTKPSLLLCCSTYCSRWDLRESQGPVPHSTSLCSILLGFQPFPFSVWRLSQSDQEHPLGGYLCGVWWRKDSSPTKVTLPYANPRGSCAKRWWQIAANRKKSWCHDPELFAYCMHVSDLLCRWKIRGLFREVCVGVRVRVRLCVSVCVLVVTLVKWRSLSCKFLMVQTLFYIFQFFYLFYNCTTLQCWLFPMMTSKSAIRETSFTETLVTINNYLPWMTLIIYLFTDNNCLKLCKLSQTNDDIHLS